MPIGKYIYCTEDILRWGVLRSHKCLSASTFTVPYYLIMVTIHLEVTNAYRQVHLLYQEKFMAKIIRTKSQMPIGKYIYCT